MTWRCYGCDLNWAPFMTVKGACPKCGAGTVRINSGISPEAVVEHARMKARAAKANNQNRFENYYLHRQQQIDAAQRPAGPIDALEQVGDMPTFDPGGEGI